MTHSIWTGSPSDEPVDDLIRGLGHDSVVGALGGIRTRDLIFGRDPLYPLSYERPPVIPRREGESTMSWLTEGNRMKLLHLAKESNAPRQVFDRSETESDTDAATPHAKPHAEFARLHARIATLDAEVVDLEAALAELSERE